MSGSLTPAELALLRERIHEDRPDDTVHHDITRRELRGLLDMLDRMQAADVFRRPLTPPPGE